MVEGQENRLFDLLSDFKPHRTDEILSVVYGSEHLGIARISARIFGLKKKGHKIDGYRDPNIQTLYYYMAIFLKINDPYRCCSVPQCNRPADHHHIKTRSTLSKKLWKEAEFQEDLCRYHHSEIHQIGPTAFCKKYEMKELYERHRKLNWRLGPWVD